MPSDAMHLLQVVVITVGLAVTAWFAAYAIIGLVGRTVKRIAAMIRRTRRTNIERRPFPAIAWGITLIVVALFLILIFAKLTRG